MKRFFKTHGGLLSGLALVALGAVLAIFSFSHDFGTLPFLGVFFGIYAVLIGIEIFVIVLKARREAAAEKRSERNYAKAAENAE